MSGTYVVEYIEHGMFGSLEVTLRFEGGFMDGVEFTKQVDEEDLNEGMLNFRKEMYGY